MSRFIAFLGPTLRHADGARILSCDYRPPAAMGELYRACKDRPQAIVLIDGEFGNKPSVMHQEILSCLSRGIAVIGASSMGALRASELSQLGMTGWGGVFRLFASGALTDDDEVAVAHAPAELGWQQVTHALVDIRYAMARAWRAGAISQGHCRELIAIAKALHFGSRTTERIADIAHNQAVPEPVIAAFQLWTSSPENSLKRLDALSLLSALATGFDRIPPSIVASAPHTAVWHRTMQALDQGAGRATPGRQYG